MTLEQQVEQALDEIRPNLQQDGGNVELVAIRDHVAYVKLQGACSGCPSAGATLRDVIERKVRERCPEIQAVAEVDQPGQGNTHDHHHHHQQQQQRVEPTQIKGVKSVIVVASGKGGVGKSTIAVNLALAFSKLGKRVGLLDADIYGPSIPTMLGVDEQPQSDENNTVRPIEKFGISLMSIGFFLDPNMPVIWRGPMVNRALTQFISDVNWGELDVLVVDLPPGTGDAQLTLIQNVAVDGAVVVTTPSDVALIDAQRAMGMFYQLDVPVFGLIENMSHFVCPHCNHQTDIFSRGGGHRVATENQVEFLGEIPLHPDVRLGGDKGKPVVVAAPDGEQAKLFANIAGQLLEYLEERKTGESEPKKRASV